MNLRLVVSLTCFSLIGLSAAKLPSTSPPPLPSASQIETPPPAAGNPANGKIADHGTDRASYSAASVPAKPVVRSAVGETAIPNLEPATLLLLGGGLVMLAHRYRRRRN